VMKAIGIQIVEEISVLRRADQSGGLEREMRQRPVPPPLL
jgi:hypothetical protein